MDERFLLDSRILYPLFQVEAGIVRNDLAEANLYVTRSVNAP
jgi:hypothetical protein